jgi:hypothetical protein
MTSNETTSIGRHADAASATRDELVRRWLRQGKVWLLPLLLSDYGRELIERKYDAFATDRAYENRPSRRLGPLGKLVDWIVLQQDIHAGLRQRLPLVVGEVSKAVSEAWDRGQPSVRVASGPCGLARDLRRAWWSLGAPTGRLELLGLDLDSSGEVLPAAARLAKAEGVPPPDQPLRPARPCSAQTPGWRTARGRLPVHWPGRLARPAGFGSSPQGSAYQRGPRRAADRRQLPRPRRLPLRRRPRDEDALPFRRGLRAGLARVRLRRRSHAGDGETGSTSSIAAERRNASKRPPSAPQCCTH